MLIIKKIVSLKTGYQILLVMFCDNMSNVLNVFMLLGNYTQPRDYQQGGYQGNRQGRGGGYGG